MRMTNRARVFGALLVAGLVIAGCGDDDDDTSAVGDTTTTTDSPTNEGTSSGGTTPEGDAIPDDTSGDAGADVEEPIGGEGEDDSQFGTVAYSNADGSLAVLSCTVIEDDGGGAVFEMSMMASEGLDVATDGSGNVTNATDVRSGDASTGASGAITGDVLNGSAQFDGYDVTFSLDTSFC